MRKQWIPGRFFLFFERPGYEANARYDPLVFILPKVAPLTAYYFIASFLEILFATLLRRLPEVF